MARKEIGTQWDREQRNAINDNFIKLFKEYTDAGLDASDAKRKAEEALADAMLAKDIAETTREEMLAIIREQTQNGDLAPEVAQARQGHETLAENLNTIKEGLAQTDGELSKVQRNYSELSPAFVYIDDDGKKEVYTYLKPLFDRKGIKGAVAIVTDLIGQDRYMTKEQLLELYNDGWDVLSHTKSHINLTTIPISQVRDELRLSKETLNSWGIEVSGFVYPNGRRNLEVVNEVKKYYDYALITRAGNNSRPLATYELERVGVGIYGPEPFDIETYKPYVDRGIENSSLNLFMLHVEETPTERLPLIEELIDYVQAQGYNFTNFSSVYENHKNILEYGDSQTGNRESYLTVGAKGETNIKTLGVYAGDYNEYTADNIPLDFKAYTVTTNIVQATYSDGLPERGGILVTYRLSADSSFVNQEFRSIRNNTIYIRQASSNSSWGAWEETKDVIVLPQDSVSGLDTPDQFPAGKTSLVHLRDSTASGFPENLGGVLKTYRLVGDDSSTYQEYTIRRRNDTYKRYWTGNAWSGWERTNGYVVAEADSVTATTPRSEFPARSVSVLYIRRANAGGFPEDEGGVLTTYNLDVDGDFVYQEYKIYNSSNKYIRRWSRVNSTWNRWSQYNVELV